MISSPSSSISSIPVEILSRIFSYISANPEKAHLPISSVSHIFRRVWLQNGKIDRAPPALLLTRPLSSSDGSCGLYPLPWTAYLPPRPPPPSGPDGLPLPLLSSALLSYYVASGYVPSPCLLRAVALRGDVGGMRLVLLRHPSAIDPEAAARRVEIATVAGSAGHVDLLAFLVEELGWPWDPAAVFAEAVENNHEGVVAFVEGRMGRASRARLDYDRCLPYGEGMPSC